jgi:hypothetical protein|nr:MAG TPA: hypothetical protein [Caudoviricetes sp.]
MSLAAYDEGVLKYLKDAMNFDNIINSAESRAFGDVAEHTDKVKVKFPLISFWRIANPVDFPGGNFAMRHRGKIVQTDYTDQKGVRWRALPVKLTYQITIWSDRRREVDDIYRELMMYLMTDNPHIEVMMEGMEVPEKFVLEVTDTDTTTDVDSFADRGRIYTQNILVDVPEAQLLFSKEFPIASKIEPRFVIIDGLDSEL